MRIPLNASPGAVTLSQSQPLKPQRPGARDALPSAIPKQSAVRVSLSQNGLDASHKAIAHADITYPGPAHRSARKRVDTPAVRIAAAPVGEASGPILKLQKRLLQEHPDLRDESRAAIEARLLQDYGLRVDADHTYFDVFARGHNSHRTYNGWEHDSRPVQAMSLTELQMRNFPADLGEDPNGLNANTGVYTQGKDGDAFGTRNEVRLLASDLKRAIRANDIGGTYRHKLKTWWARNEAAVATLYQAQVRKWRHQCGLSPQACAMLRAVLRTADDKPVKSSVTAQVFDINSYPSKDMTWLKGPGGRVVLIMPGNARPLREYDNLDALRAAIEDMTGTVQGRAELASHFSLYNRKDGGTYQGVEKWLGDIAGGGYRARVAYAPQRIDGNIFRDQAERTRAAELDDIKRLVKSNSEVIEEESTQFVHVLAQLFPEFFFPAKATELALDVHQAIADGASEDRQRAAQDAVSAGINLAVAAALGALATPIRRMGSPTAGLAGRAAYFNPPGRTSSGRIGYLLGPAEAPKPPSTFEDLLDEADDASVAHDMTIDWSDDSFTLSPMSSRSNSVSTDTASENGDFAVGPRRGSWAPGQPPPPTPVTPQPGFGVMGNHEGLPYFNTLNWIEQLDVPHLYRAVAFEALAAHSPEISGFDPDMSVTGEDGTVVEDRYLLTMDTQEGAVDFGNATYGAGNFAVYRIDSEGVPAMSYRMNINYDMWRAAEPVVEAQAQGRAVVPDFNWLSSYVHEVPQEPGEVPEGYTPLSDDDILSYQRGHVFADSRAIDPSRIHRMI